MYFIPLINISFTLTFLLFLFCKAIPFYPYPPMFNLSSPFDILFKIFNFFSLLIFCFLHVPLFFSFYVHQSILARLTKYLYFVSNIFPLTLYCFFSIFSIPCPVSFPWSSCVLFIPFSIKYFFGNSYDALR